MSTLKPANHTYIKDSPGTSQRFLHRSWTLSNPSAWTLHSAFPSSTTHIDLYTRRLNPRESRSEDTRSPAPDYIAKSDPYSSRPQLFSTVVYSPPAHTSHYLPLYWPLTTLCCTCKASSRSCQSLPQTTMRSQTSPQISHTHCLVIWYQFIKTSPPSGHKKIRISVRNEKM